MRSITIDGGRLAFAEAGSGDAVVLIHGFPFDHTIWDAVTRQIERFGRIIRPDLRGLGTSSVTPGPYLMETLASDVAALLDNLGIERATLVGHSLGGYVALAFYRMYRERVAALALVASRVGADSAAAAAARHALAERAEREGIAPVVEPLLPRLFAPHVYEEDPALIARTKMLGERADPQGAAALLRGMAVRVDSGDLLEEIDVPFVVALGDADAILDLDEARATVAAVPSGRLEIFERVGHMPMFEATHDTGRILETLVSSAR